MKKEEIKDLSIEERIVESGLFYFDDGYLGSTNHCVEYYYDYSEDKINKIESGEYGLRCLILDKKHFDYWNDGENEDEDGNIIDNWDEFFDKWFSDCDDFEIIEDSINGGNGYGKFIVNKEEKYI